MKRDKTDTERNASPRFAKGTWLSVPMDLLLGIRDAGAGLEGPSGKPSYL